MQKLHRTALQSRRARAFSSHCLQCFSWGEPKSFHALAILFHKPVACLCIIIAIPYQNVTGLHHGNNVKKREFMEDHPDCNIHDGLHFLQWPDTKTYQYLSTLTAPSITLQKSLNNSECFWMRSKLFITCFTSSALSCNKNTLVFVLVP